MRKITNHLRLALISIFILLSVKSFSQCTQTDYDYLLKTYPIEFINQAPHSFDYIYSEPVLFTSDRFTFRFVLVKKGNNFIGYTVKCNSLEGKPNQYWVVIPIGDKDIVDKGFQYIRNRTETKMFIPLFQSYHSLVLKQMTFIHN